MLTKETTLRTELCHFFAKHLQLSEEVPKAKRIRLKLYTEGKALTNNEVIEMLNNLEEKKAKTRDKGKTRQKSQAKKTVETVQSPDNSNEDTDHCFMCSAAYLDAEAREWIDCNKCYRWYHLKCTGFARLPKPSELFLCHICKN